MKKRLWKGGILALVLLSVAIIVTVHDNDKLSDNQAEHALQSWMPQGATVSVIGVQPIPQLGAANVDFYATNVTINLPKNDAITAYVFGPGGGTTKWTGNGHAIFKHYTDGWMLSKIVLGKWQWENININVK